MKAATRRFLVAVLVCSAIAGVEAQEVVVSPVKGVVAAGTPIRLVKDGFGGSEGPLPQADGSLLFTENTAGHIARLAADGSVSTWMQNAGANALALNPKGEVVAAITVVGKMGIGVLQPGAETRMLARDFKGTPFTRPNDLVVGKLGQIYFSDPVTPGATDGVLRTPALYQLTAQGELLQLATDIERPNGVALSPDERKLYVANTAGESIIVFNLDKAGKVTGRSNFVKLAMPPAPAPQSNAQAASATAAPAPATPLASGADGLAVDRDGRLYVATAVGVQVFSERGAALGVIALPRQPQNLAFAGPKRSTLYVVGRGAVFRIDTQTQGRRRAGK